MVVLKGDHDFLPVLFVRENAHRLQKRMQRFTSLIPKNRKKEREKEREWRRSQKCKKGSPATSQERTRMGEKAGFSSSNSENRWESKGVTCPFVVDQLSEVIL